MRDCHAGQIENTNLSRYHKVIIFVEQVVESHCGDTHCILNGVDVGVKNSGTNKNNSR